MTILDLCERELLKELEDDHILLAQTTVQLRSDTTQEYYRFLVEMVSFKKELEKEKINENSISSGN